MSHYSVLAIGFKDEEALENAMAPYDEGLEVAPRISKTKEQILAEGIKSYKERCEIIKAYEESPFKAVEKYGDRAAKIYEDRHKRQYPNFKDPEKYYEWYVEGETVDENGNLLTTYNPNSRWDYYTVEEGELEQVDMSTPTAACFYRYGIDDVPDGSLLVPLINPDVLFWTNDPDESLQMRAELVAYPFPQTLTGYADMSSETILGITMLSAEYSGEIDIRLSYDEGATYGATMSMAEFLQMDVDTLWQNCQAHKSLYIQFTLHNDARLTRFKISYKN